MKNLSLYIAVLLTLTLVGCIQESTQSQLAMELNKMPNNQLNHLIFQKNTHTEKGLVGFVIRETDLVRVGQYFAQTNNVKREAKNIYYSRQLQFLAGIKDPALVEYLVNLLNYRPAPNESFDQDGNIVSPTEDGGERIRPGYQAVLKEIQPN